MFCKSTKESALILLFQIRIKKTPKKKEKESPLIQSGKMEKKRGETTKKLLPELIKGQCIKIQPLDTNTLQKQK